MVACPWLRGRFLVDWEQAEKSKITKHNWIGIRIAFIETLFIVSSNKEKIEGFGNGKKDAFFYDNFIVVMRHTYWIYILGGIFCFLTVRCEGQARGDIEEVSAMEEEVEVLEEDPIFQAFNRDAIKVRLKEKIQNGEALYAHVLVPLCDNENQGIVPVPKLIGNGLDTKNNLYWGAGYGIKTHLGKRSDWKLLKSETDVSGDVLERLTFYKVFPNGARVYMVADAYRGDRMKACLSDYLNALAGKNRDSVRVNEDWVKMYGGADLVVFNGHNGLMDTEAKFVKNVDGRKKDAVAIACISGEYFRPYINYAGGYPLVMTTNYMAPEAYVIEAILNGWASGIEEESIRLKAGDAYNKYQKCGVNGARRLFKTGW